MPHADKAAPPHDSLAFLAGGGEMAERIRAFDWATTSVGPLESWPQSLRSAVSILLPSKASIILFWGRDLLNVYNDAYRPVFGRKHPQMLGQPAHEAWKEIWHSGLRELLEGVLETGEAYWASDRPFYLQRYGYVEETFFDVSYDPVRDESGRVGGVFCIVSETTGRVLSARRLRTLRDLGSETTAGTATAEEACSRAAAILGANRHDVPFALIYLLDADGRTARLAAATGLPAHAPVSPAAIDLLDPPVTPWPLAEVSRCGTSRTVTGIDPKLGSLPSDVWPEPTHTAVVLPVAQSGQERPAGFLIAGISPRRTLDDEYRSFLDLAAAQVASAVANARAYEQERQRAEALAEIDRAKTAFFSNVSHEFRTPLTLMLGPVEDLLARRRGELPASAADQLDTVHRNGLRLLRLVNALLDFSRIEAGRVRAQFRPTDLAALTADLASVFRSACERAGLRLVVDCPRLSADVYVDPDMWEKVVLNLLSNAFKFTLEGEIDVSLRERAGSVVLRVRDTGTGIAPEEIPRLFERFHRIQNARARTHEGSGIGLALVQELVKLHHGSIHAESVAGAGTTFEVSLPLGSAHLPADQIAPAADPQREDARGNPFIQEALLWLPAEGAGHGDDQRPLDGHPVRFARRGAPEQDARPTILVADDNADMRTYIVRLLEEHYAVEAVADGHAALEAVRRQPPDLVLTDVMMPRLDGFGLLAALRAHPRTSGLPVIMLSARAGEESRVEGMDAGADDYLVKPFAARELLARVTAHLQMSRARQQAHQSLRRSEERLRMALTAARMVAWQFDVAANEIILSDNAADVLGLPAGTAVITADEGFALNHPDDVARHRAESRRALAEGRPYQCQYRIVRPDNQAVVWVEEWGRSVTQGSGETARLIGVVMDITERKQVERLLQDSEAHFRSMADSAPTMLWVTDDSGACTYLSRQWVEFTGRAAAEDLGFGWLEHTHPDDRAASNRVFESANRRQRPFTMDYRLRRHDGEYRWVQDVGLPRFDDEGGFVGFVGTVTDVHDRKQAEEALKESDRRKDEFLATLAHELRNPLAPLRNGLQVLKLAGDDVEVAERARAMMERQLAQMVRLIDDLMDVSRISRGRFELRRERVELASVVPQAVETSRPLIEERHHTLTIELPPVPVVVNADVTRLTQVLSNLLNNAAKYTEPGGRITVQVRAEGREAVVMVRDTGVGIPTHMIDRVFDLFTQVERSPDPSRGGLGIGLSLVRGLVEMHGGRVEARSAGLGRGSEFVVRLPAVSSAARSDDAAGAQAEAAAMSPPRRILVVDDNIDSAESCAILLRLMGNETQTANDGLEAIEVAAAFRPDVILLDIGMPQLDGYETCRRIRQQSWGRELVLVACTGWGQDDDRRRSLDAGFDFHLVKPVNPVELRQLLEQPKSR